MHGQAPSFPPIVQPKLESRAMPRLPILLLSCTLVSGFAAALVEPTTLRVFEDMNPDGTHASSRFNARGVDLNRNFPASNFRSGRG